MKQLDLQDIRQQLDAVDDHLIQLFLQRMELCRQVALHKKETGKAVYDAKREQEKLYNVSRKVEGEFFQQAVGELFVQLMTVSRRYQYQILNQLQDPCQTNDFKKIEGLPKKVGKVIYQGVEGAYTHEAALQYFGKETALYHVRTWNQVMAAVDQGEAQYGVLPIENSSAGTVADNYDLLAQYNLFIVGEVFLPVDHYLLGRADADPERIKVVYSHPQALMQCSEFLSRHPDWKLISVENTAIAAKKILAEQDPGQVAIASAIAGDLYGLKKLAASINDNKENTTRFLIVAKTPVYTEAAKKVSICFELPHQSGTLYHMLGHFIYNGVNMVMIESRPVRERNWEYRFFVDLEGNLGDIAICNALSSIGNEARNMRVLGNY